MISLKAVWSSRSRITLFRCQRFNNWVFAMVCDLKLFICELQEQQDTIDSIEGNIESAQVHVEEGTRALGKVGEHQGRGIENYRVHLTPSLNQ